MIHSMTAFARNNFELKAGSFIWEIRSVNHRYLEQSFRLPEKFREIEPQLREILRKRLARGKVEVSLRMELGSQDSASLSLNHDLVLHLLTAASAIEKNINTETKLSPAPLNALDLMQWPGVMVPTQLDYTDLHRQGLEQFKQILDSFILVRQREGTELGKLIERRLDDMSQQIALVQSKMPDIIKQQKQKLHDKIAAAQVEVDAERLEQEIVIIAQKIDVDEEMDRLNTHINEFKRILKADGAMGRRLDFLLQELNREANTLASKSIDAQTTQAAVELKVLIEQIREQVQNIE